MEENQARVREPLVDGVFYSAEPDELQRHISRLIRHTASNDTRGLNARAVISPSASYDYVGSTMAAAYRRIAIHSHPIVVVIAAGQNVDEGYAALPTSDWYRTPFGLISVERKLCNGLMSSSSRFIEDDFVHLEEHAVETQLPFLQFMLDSLTLLPVLVGKGDPSTVHEMSEALRQAMAGQDRPYLIVLGTNLTSYQSRDEGYREGSRLLDAIASLNWQRIANPRATFTIGASGRTALALFLSLLGENGECTVVARSNSSLSTADPSTTVEYAACSCTSFDEGR